MRNAIKHERCNADAHADFNNKTTRLLHLHFSFKNRMCTKYIRDERGLEVFFVHCGLPRLHFNKIIFSTLGIRDERVISLHVMHISTALLTKYIHFIYNNG